MDWSTDDDEALEALMQEMVAGSGPTITKPGPQLHTCQCRCRRYWRGGLMEILDRSSMWREPDELPPVLPRALTRLPSTERLAVLRLADLMMTVLGAMVDSLDDRANP